MPMYTLATIPIIRKVDGNIMQTWYADDASTVGLVKKVQEWWDKLSFIGPKFGSFTNASKMWLVTKKAHLAKAIATFADTGIKVT